LFRGLAERMAVLHVNEQEFKKVVRNLNSKESLCETLCNLVVIKGATNIYELEI